MLWLDPFWIHWMECKQMQTLPTELRKSRLYSAYEDVRVYACWNVCDNLAQVNQMSWVLFLRLLSRFFRSLSPITLLLQCHVKKSWVTRLFSSSVHVTNTSEIFWFFIEFPSLIKIVWNMFHQSKIYQNLNNLRIVLRVLQHFCERISSDGSEINLKFNIGIVSLVFYPV